MTERIKEHFLEAQSVLNAFLLNQENFVKLEAAGELLVKAINEGKKIISCGNGGSMCDAMHFAEELSGRYRDDRKALPAISISDPSHLSCVANDYGYAFAFSRMVEAIGQPGDVLLGISTSGNSENVINAAMAARQKGISVIALTGKEGGKLAALCDIELRAPQSKFSDRVQEIHIKIIHSLIDYIEVRVSH